MYRSRNSKSQVFENHESFFVSAVLLKKLLIRRTQVRVSAIANAIRVEEFYCQAFATAGVRTQDLWIKQYIAIPTELVKGRSRYKNAEKIKVLGE